MMMNSEARKRLEEATEQKEHTPMTSKQDIIARINKMRPFEVKADDAYAHGQNDTIDRVVTLLEALLDEDGIDIDAPLNEVLGLL